MAPEVKTFTQDDVDTLRRDWESAQFELKTNEVLGQINKRLDESNNYKNTFGKDLRDIKIRIEAVELNRAAEAKKLSETLEQKRSWHQDWWVRVGIFGAIIYEILSSLHLMKVLG